MTTHSLTQAGASITSLEISEMVEKRHDNVRRTIETLADNGVIRLPQIEVSENINNLGFKQSSKHYVFAGEQGKRDSIVVVAQLSPEFTARLVDRWQELEAKLATGLETYIRPKALTIYEEAVSMLQAEITAASILLAPLHLAQIEAVKAVRSTTGVDYSRYLAISPAQNNIAPEQEMLEPTELARRLGLGSAIALNKRLEAEGAQTKVNGAWQPTEDAAPYCFRHA